jgi:hypothetical protein
MCEGFRLGAIVVALGILAVGCEGWSMMGQGSDGVIRGAPEDADLWLVPPNVCETPVVDHKFKESFEVASSVMNDSTSFGSTTWRCDIKIRAKVGVTRRRIRERLYDKNRKVIHEDRWYVSAAADEMVSHTSSSFKGKDGIVKFEMVVER